MFILIVGPMSSGKTTEMMRRVRKYIVANKRVLIVGSIESMRENEDLTTIASHNDITIPCIRIHNTGLMELLSRNDNLSAWDVIVVDEGQFFTDLTDFVRILTSAGKTVIVTALLKNFKAVPYKEVTRACAYAEKIKKFCGICMDCSSQYGNYSYRNNRDDDREFVVGGDKEYTTLCLECYDDRMRSDRTGQVVSPNDDVEEGGEDKPSADDFFAVDVDVDVVEKPSADDFFAVGVGV